MPNAKLLAVWAFAGCWGVSAGSTFYVSSSGRDTNTGTSQLSPWKTVAEVNARKFVQGDEVLFEGGKTFSGNLYLSTNVKGTHQRPVVFSSYGEGRATIEGGSGSGIFVYNVGGISIENLKVSANWNAQKQNGNSGAGIYLYTDLVGAVKQSGITVEDCEVSGFRNGGILILSWPSDGSQSGFDDVSISHSTIHDNGDSGIASEGPNPSAGSTAYAHSNVYVGWNDVFDNQGIKGLDQHSGDGIVLGDVDGGTIEDCVAYGNGGMSTSESGGPAAIWTWDSHAVTIQYCEAHNNLTGPGTPDGDGFDLDGGATNCVVQYNYAHENSGAGFLVYEYGDERGNNSNNVIRFNVSQNDAKVSPGYAGLYLGGNCSNDLIYNNTFYNRDHLPIYLGGGSGTWLINNIFFTDSDGGFTADIVTTNCWLLDNDYWPGPYAQQISYNGITYSSLASLQNIGQETWDGHDYGFAEDPVSINPGYGPSLDTGKPWALLNYELQARSPLIRAGFDLSAWSIDMGSTDFNLHRLPPVNVGAG